MKRSKFSLSYYRLLSARMGGLYPIGITEVLPGDTIQHNTSLLVRSLQLLAPLMHPVGVKVHHWFVPHRLVWSSFEDFITGGQDGLNASVFPTLSVGAGVAIGSLGDHLGIEPAGAWTEPVSALPFRGYSLIYNEWYRDADLMSPVVVSLADGTDVTTNTALQSAAWEKDYFTSSRPTAKKGPSTAIPLTGVSPVVANPSITESPVWRTMPGDALAAGAVTGQAATGDVQVAAADAYFDPVSTGGQGSLLVSATGGLGNPGFTMAVDGLREALALQRYQEARSRYGSRYTEYLRYLNVRSSDARLQVPEYLGGGSAPLQFSEVLQTAEGTNAVGTMRGHGISSMRTNRYRRFFEEHGYVYTMLIARPKGIYTQGIPRHWNRRSKEDFWQRELEHIGQQEILRKEIYAGAAVPSGVFGYQDRYDEYRRNESTVSGEFRDTLDFWHMARNFASEPSLNAAFVTSNPTDRIYPVTGDDTLYIMASHSMQARRLVSRNATPRTF